jgi:hypothetical protein
MYSPYLQHLFAQARIEELHRSRQSQHEQPIITNERIAAGQRRVVKLPAYLSQAITRFVSQSAPKAYAV